MSLHILEDFTLPYRKVSILLKIHILATENLKHSIQLSTKGSKTQLYNQQRPIITQYFRSSTRV